MNAQSNTPANLSIPTVLIIETWGWEKVIVAIIRGLGSKCKFILAHTATEAEGLLREQNRLGTQFDFDAVIVSGRLDQNSLQTREFVLLARKMGFKGPILANSNNDVHNQELLKAGASAANQGKKEDAGDHILRLLDDEALKAIVDPAVCALVRFAHDKHEGDANAQVIALVAAILPTVPDLRDQVHKICSTRNPRFLEATIDGALCVRHVANYAGRRADPLVPLENPAQEVLALFKKEAAPSA